MPSHGSRNTHGTCCASPRHRFRRPDASLSREKMKKLYTFGRPLWLVMFEVSGAVLKAIFRRLLGRPKKKEWSFSLEVTVSAARALMRDLITPHEIELLAQGSNEDKQRVRDKMAALQKASKSAPIPSAGDLSVQELKVGGNNAVWIKPMALPTQFERSSSACKVMLYLHGGGYVLCGVRTYMKAMYHLARVTGLPVLGAEYGLMPDCQFEEMLQNAVQAFHHLVHTEGYRPHEIVVAGDSAGGHLAITLALHLAAADPHMRPGAVCAFCPWIDPMEQSPSTARGWEASGDLDVITPGWLRMAKLGFQGSVFGSLLSSEVVQMLSLLPPSLIQAGGAEGFCAQIVEFGRVAKEVQAPVELEVYPHQVHGFQQYSERMCPEAAAAIKAVKRFLLALPARG